ncbi:MAG: hypothetical protein V4659_11285 [Pseudomonadota bacterium]
MIGVWRVLALVVLAQAAACAAASETDQAPAVAVRQIVTLSNASRLGSPEGKALLGGEFAKFNGASFGPLGKPGEPVMQGASDAVVRFAANSSVQFDAYFFLHRETHGWVLRAARTLALPQFVFLLRDQLRAKAERTSKDAATLRNLELTTRSDAELRDWFVNHRVALDRMRGLNADAARHAAEEIDALIVETDANAYQRVVLGGILDNSVGFLFVPHDKPPPTMSASDYIWIESVGYGWHLFKTT